MKDLRFISLKKRKDSFYKKLGTIETKKRSVKTLEYISRRSYEALPAFYKRYLDNPQAEIKNAAMMAKYSEGGFDFYNAFIDKVKDNPMFDWLENRRRLWSEFRTRVETKKVYHKYMSYMQRRGINGTQYWYDHVEYTSLSKHAVETTLMIPDTPGFEEGKQNVKIYTVLYIYFDYSGLSISASFD